MNETPARFQISGAQVKEFMQTLSNWGKWGNQDQLGALNYITPEKTCAAASLVREGITVGTARPLPTEAAPDNHFPVRHLMTAVGSDPSAASSGDYFAITPHGYAITHLDALCHVFYKEWMYNGYPRDKVTSTGAELNSIDALRSGIATRGVLLDIPRTKRLPWLEPGHAVFPDDLEECEEACSVRVEQGDFLLIRTGRFAYRDSRGPWDARETMPGLHASCLPWLHHRQVAALGCDGISDVLPSRVDRIRLPIHLIGIVGMGLHLLDNAELETLGAACAERRRWDFFLVVAPLVLLRGTASPANPIAIF